MKWLAVVFLPVVFCSSLFAQDYKLNERYPGYFINVKNDTIRGYILLINKLDNQMGSEYSNDPRAEKIRLFLKPDEVKGFKVKDRVYTSLEYGDIDDKPQHFLLTLAEGKLNLYQYFRLAKDLYVGTGTGQRPATGDDEQYLQSEYVIVEGNKQYAIEGQASLLKHADIIFSGDAALLKRVEDKEKGYRYKDLLSLVQQYNVANK